MKKKSKKAAVSKEVQPLSVILVLVTLLVTAFILYAFSLNNPIVFDTTQVFSAETLQQYFYELSLFKRRSFPNFSFGFIYQLFGGIWLWQRAFQVVLHALTSFALFLFAREWLQGLLQGDDDQDKTLLKVDRLAFAAALLFVLHPVAVYGVAYLIQRSIVMATLFGLLMLWSFLKGLRQDHPKWFLLAAGFYFLATHSKEHAVLLPLLFVPLVLMEKGLDWSYFFKKLGWVVVIFVALAVHTTMLQRNIYGSVYEPHADLIITNLNQSSADTSSAVTSRSDNLIWLNFMNQASLYFKYLSIWVYPNPERFWIDMAVPFSLDFQNVKNILGSVGFLLWPVLAIFLMRRRNVLRAIGFLLFASWALFLVEFSVVRLAETFVVYRSYLWMVFVPLLLVLVLHQVSKNKAVFFVGLVLSLGFCWWAAKDRLRTFDSELLVWTDAMDKNERFGYRGVYNSYRPYNNVAFALVKKGENERAIPFYHKALQINPSYARARSNLASVYVSMSEYQKAREQYRKAVEYNSRYLDAYVGLGVCASELGEYAEAVRYYQKALQIDPKAADAYYNLGNLYLKLENFDLALENFNQAIQHNSRLLQAYHNKGVLLSQLKRRDEAIATFKQVLEINPNYEPSRKMLGILEKVRFQPKKVKDNAL